MPLPGPAGLLGLEYMWICLNYSVLRIQRFMMLLKDVWLAVSFPDVASVCTEILPGFLPQLLTVRHLSRMPLPPCHLPSRQPLGSDTHTFSCFL